MLRKRGVWHTPIYGTLSRCGRCAINVNFRHGLHFWLHPHQPPAPGRVPRAWLPHPRNSSSVGPACPWTASTETSAFPTPRTGGVGIGSTAAWPTGRAATAGDAFPVGRRLGGLDFPAIYSLQYCEIRPGYSLQTSDHTGQIEQLFLVALCRLVHLEAFALHVMEAADL